MDKQDNEDKKRHKRKLLWLLLLLLLGGGTTSIIIAIATRPKDHSYDLGTYRLAWSQLYANDDYGRDQYFWDNLISFENIDSEYKNEPMDDIRHVHYYHGPLESTKNINLYPVNSPKDLKITNNSIEVIGKYQPFKFTEYPCEFIWQYTTNKVIFDIMALWYATDNVDMGNLVDEAALPHVLPPINHTLQLTGYGTVGTITNDTVIRKMELNLEIYVDEEFKNNSTYLMWVNRYSNDWQYVENKFPD